MRSRMLLLFLALPLLSACDEKFLVIESDTSWSGDISGYGQVAGTGDAEIDLTDAPSNVCWTLKKETDEGSLRAYLNDDTWFGLGSEVDDDQTTTDPMGQVMGCNR